MSSQDNDSSGSSAESGAQAVEARRKPRNPTGRNGGAHRPSGYRSEKHDELAFRLALLGGTNPEIADAMGVTHMTLSRWMSAHETFRCALNRGRDTADGRVVKSLYRRANGYSHKAVKIFLNKQGEPVYAPYVERFPPDTIAAIFWLKNRQPARWRDKHDLDMTVNGRIGRLPDDDRSTKALELLQRLVGSPVKPGPVIDVAPAEQEPCQADVAAATDDGTASEE